MPASRAASAGRGARPRRTLTELEGCVLGIVWARGPCTAYVARKEFLDSPSPYWSGSAGAVYPLMARLERWGLVRALPGDPGRRPGRRFVLTTAGRTALRRWLGPPLPEWILGIPMDPLRTRMSFLGALPTRRQAVFLAEAKRHTRAHLDRSRREEAREEAGRDRFERLVVRGAVMILEARLAWLKAARRRVVRGR